MDELLGRLDRLIGRLPDRAFFGPPAEQDDVAATETAIGRTLPEAYRQFLLAHDGGFISSHPVPPDNTEAFATARWNANHLRGCEDLVREYEDAVLLARDMEPDLVDWPYVPFCHTNGQEILVFGPPGPDGVHPVLDAWHEIGPEEWGVLSPDFASFLGSYIDGCGFPPTIAIAKG